MTLQYRPSDGSLLYMHYGPSEDALMGECCCTTCISCDPPFRTVYTVALSNLPEDLSDYEGSYECTIVTESAGACIWEFLEEESPTDWFHVTFDVAYPATFPFGNVNVALEIYESGCESGPYGVSWRLRGMTVDEICEWVEGGTLDPPWLCTDACGSDCDEMVGTAVVAPLVALPGPGNAPQRLPYAHVADIIRSAPSTSPWPALKDELDRTERFLALHAHRSACWKARQRRRLITWYRTACHRHCLNPLAPY